jgi:ankyrin repeat protein
LVAESVADPSYRDNTVLFNVGIEPVVDLELIRLLLKDSRVDPSVERHSILANSCKIGNLEYVNLLLSHPKIDPNFRDYAITHSCNRSHKDIAELLLDKYKANGNAALISVCTIGNLMMTKWLIEEKKINPACESNSPLRIASKKKQAEIVEYLLTLPNVDPMAE